jgi:hypothetical protein
MAKKLLIFLSVFFLIQSGIRAQGIAATLDYCNFKANDSLGMLEYYLSFPANSLEHKKTDEGKSQSEIKVMVGMVSGTDTIYFDSYIMNSSPNSETTIGFEEYLVQNRIILPNGEYSFFLSAEDLISQQESKLNIEFPVKLGYDNALLQVSDIQNLKSYRSVDQIADNVKNGVEMISRNSNFFSKPNDKFIFYTEVYNADKVMEKGTTYLLEARVADVKTGEFFDNTGIFKKMTAESVSPVLAEVDLSKIPSGEYNLVIDVKDRNNQSLYSKKKCVQRVHPDMNDIAEAENDAEYDSTANDPFNLREHIDMKELFL